MKLGFKPLLLPLFVSLILALSTGCRTADGLGDDIEKAGDEIEDALD